MPTLAAALKAVDAGVDGLVVEGGEGGGFKNPRDVATMVLLPLVCSKVDVPVIAAGGICDGPIDGGRVRARRRGRADGQRAWCRRRSRRCTRTGSSAILDAAETDTVFLNRFSPPRPARAAHRSAATALERQEHVGFESSARAMDLYFGGDMEASIALGGQVVGRIDAVKPVAQIIDETVDGFHATIARLAAARAQAAAAMERSS